MDGADAIKYILNNRIDGDIVECGVGDGNFEYIWINELMKHKTFRNIYMYDTFAGLVEPSKYDYTCENAKLYKMDYSEVHDRWKSSIINDRLNWWCYTPLDDVKNKLNSTGYPQEYLHYIVGDVMETLNVYVPQKIAILRLDTDWYESSKYELEKLYDNVVVGGVIVFDDYYHWDGQRRATEEFFKSRNLSYDFVDLGNSKTSAIIKKPVY